VLQITFSPFVFSCPLMSGFASTVLLGDLNDFIAPSQSCVNPIFTTPQPTDKISGALPKVGLALENDFGMQIETTPPPNLIKLSDSNTAQVSLSDCLACSGCVTSAETVLIEQQSFAEFEKAVNSDSYDLVVVTLSNQSCASLAAHFSFENQSEARARVSDFLKTKYNVNHVIDASFAGDIALLEHGYEFVHRFKNRLPVQAWEPPTTSIAVSSQEINVSPLNPSIITPTTDTPPAYLPLLSSVCPGWICYAEKSNPEVIPYVSGSKSPQQIAGTMVKRYLGSLSGLDPARIYHATVMPCADKKLESSRKDFWDASSNSQDVDCVLTTHEIAIGMEDAVVPMSIEDSQEYPIYSEFIAATSDGNFGYSPTFGGSGGYLDFVYRFAAKEIFNITVPDGALPYKAGRNNDIHVVDLMIDNKIEMKFAAIYGFRNIQAVIRQLKRGKCPYDFVEIMACPGGCLNGGGQIRPSNKNDLVITDAAVRRERLDDVSTIFHHRIIRPPQQNNAVKSIYSTMVLGDPYSANARAYFHTRYHAIPKLENPLLQRW